MKSEDRKVIRSGFWYTISNFISKGIVFLTTPVFTRLMSVSAFGEYSSFITWQSLLVLVLPLALYSSVNRARLDFPGEMDNYLTSITLMGSGITALFYIIILFFLDEFEFFFGMDSLYIHIMFLFILLEPALSNFQSLNQAEFNYRTVTVISLSSCALSVSASILFSYVFEDKMLGRVIGYDGTLIVFYALVYIRILTKGRKPSIQYLK